MKYQLFPNLTADEMEALTADVKERGVMVPVEVDENGDILDGHHRAMIADSLGITYPTVVREGWSEDQKLVHVVALNAHRRHLSVVERSEVVGRLRKERLSTRAIAKAVGVDQRTVRRDLSIAADAAMPETIATSDGRSYPATRPGQFRPRLILEPYQYGTDGTAALAPAPVEPDVWAPATGLMSSDTAEWYTPVRVLDAVVLALGMIDLDPCAEPEKSVPALVHFTEKDDGLSRDWPGTVYMNPPYGRPITAWIEKLAAEHRAGRTTAAIALLPGRIETDWFYALEAEWLCNIEGRLAFSGHPNAAPFPSVAVYLGPDGEAFADAFMSLGDVYERRRRFER